MLDLFRRKPIVPYKKFPNGILLNADCVEMGGGLPRIRSNSVHLILVDLPYGTTGLEWDFVIDIDFLWKHWKRVLIENGSVVLFSSQPFTTTLANSNPEWFKYEWIWVKNKATGFVHAHNKPQKLHENILVFSSGTTVHKGQSKNRMTYNPQGIRRVNRVVSNHGHNKSGIHSAGLHAGAFKSSPKTGQYGGSACLNGGDLKEGKYLQEYTNYPMSVLTFDKDSKDIKHPTQKPIKLCEYLIRTYSNPGEVVLDNTCGYASTGVGAIRAGRRFICIEKDNSWYKESKHRLKKHTEKNKHRDWWSK